jgi:hypothetical protein
MGQTTRGLANDHLGLLNAIKGVAIANRGPRRGTPLSSFICTTNCLPRLGVQFLWALGFVLGLAEH